MPRRGTLYFVTRDNHSIDRCEASSNEKMEGGGVENLLEHDDCGGNWNV